MTRAKKEEDMTIEEWLDYQEIKRIFRRDYADRYAQRFNVDEDLEDEKMDKF